MKNPAYDLSGSFKLDDDHKCRWVMIDREPWFYMCDMFVFLYQVGTRSTGMSKHAKKIKKENIKLENLERALNGTDNIYIINIYGFIDYSKYLLFRKGYGCYRKILDKLFYGRLKTIRNKLLNFLRLYKTTDDLQQILDINFEIWNTQINIGSPLETCKERILQYCRGFNGNPIVIPYANPSLCSSELYKRNNIYFFTKINAIHPNSIRKAIKSLLREKKLYRKWETLIGVHRGRYYIYSLTPFDQSQKGDESMRCKFCQGTLVKENTKYTLSELPGPSEEIIYCMMCGREPQKEYQKPVERVEQIKKKGDDKKVSTIMEVYENVLLKYIEQNQPCMIVYGINNACSIEAQNEHFKFKEFFLSHSNIIGYSNERMGRIVKKSLELKKIKRMRKIDGRASLPYIYTLFNYQEKEQKSENININKEEKSMNITVKDFIASNKSMEKKLEKAQKEAEVKQEVKEIIQEEMSAKPNMNLTSQWMAGAEQVIKLAKETKNLTVILDRKQEEILELSSLTRELKAKIENNYEAVKKVQEEKEPLEKAIKEITEKLKFQEEYSKELEATNKNLSEQVEKFKKFEPLIQACGDNGKYEKVLQIASMIS